MHYTLAWLLDRVKVKSSVYCMRVCWIDVFGNIMSLNDPSLTTAREAAWRALSIIRNKYRARGHLWRTPHRMNTKSVSSPFKEMAAWYWVDRSLLWKITGSLVVANNNLRVKN